MQEGNEMETNSEMLPLISIIVPVYNMELYLKRCLESLLLQSYKNIEIILVDDGSRDSSGAICDEAAKNDSRVKVHHIANGGVGNARNVGLSVHKGEWFCFVDSDDWIEEDYVEILYRNAKEYECDISGCSFSRDYSFTKGINKDDERIVVLDNTQKCIHNFICPGLSLNGMSCFKIYRSCVFADVRFSTTVKVNEDCLYTFEIMKKCNRACVTSEKLYHWFFRNDSACHSKPKSLDFSAADVFLYIIDGISEWNDSEATVHLKLNYVKSAINVLVNVPFYKKDRQAQAVLKRIKAWKKDVWEFLSLKERIKYYLVLKGRPVLLIGNKFRK